MILFFTFFVLVKTVHGLDPTELSACPTWYDEGSNDSITCICRDIEGLVTCVRDVQQVRLSEGVCMTYNNDSEDIEVGKCPYAVFDPRYAALRRDGYIFVPKNVSELNQFMCEGMGREGSLCSNCKSDHGLTIANVYMRCVKCKLPQKVAWLFYFGLELIPLTILFFIVTVFRISLATPPLNGYVIFCQLALALLFTHTHHFNPPYVMDSPLLQGLHRLLLIVLGVWNMTLTRFIETITSFCVDSSISMQQAFTMTQIQSLFPLLLIALTSMVIELHARNCRLVVCLWRPFHKRFVCCTRLWNSKLSLVDVFSTYLLFSYSRFVIELYFIFSFQHTFKLSCRQCYATRLLYNPSVPYFDTMNHLSYVVILLLILFAIAFPPVILLFFYQFRFFQKMFQFTCLYRSHAIHAFIDLFHGCYKDGTAGVYDLRFTASLYLLLRVVIVLCYILCDFTTLASCGAVSMFVWVFLLLLFTALIRPYKTQRMNILDSLMLASLAFVCVLFTAMYPTIKYQHINVLILIVVLIIIALPQAVLFFFIALKVCKCVCRYRLCTYFVIKFKRKLSDKTEMMESFVEQSGYSYNRME